MYKNSKAMDKDTKKKRKTLDDLFLKKNKRSKTSKASDDDEDLFLWEDHLKKCRAKAVPKTAFKHVDNSNTIGFTPGMKIEAKDQSSSTGTYWVATVVMVSGPLLLLRFDGYDNDRSGDFWCNASSPDLQPIGWCAKTNTVLIPPGSIRHKETNWAKFLMTNLRDAVAAPDYLFHKSQEEEDKDELNVGQKLELQDSEDPLCYWVASIVERFGMRLQLRYEGVDSVDEDVWVYYLSDNVHNLGWGKKNGMTLQPPKDITSKVDWSKIIDDINKLPDTQDNGQSNNKLRKDDSLPPLHGFQSGMKLEAVNPIDPSSICVATVNQIINEYYFMVEIDNLAKSEDRISFWCHAKSRNIFPCGWCEKNKVSVIPPPGYQIKPFTWDGYLSYGASKAAPKSLFCQAIPKNEFEIGFKLEAVDQTKPDTISVATVKQVMAGRTIWVQLDGYASNVVEHIYDVESYDLFPVNWCSMHGHPLLTPQQKKVANSRLRSLRATSQRLAKAVSSTSEATPNHQTSSPTTENSPTNETHKKKLTPLNTPLKEIKPEPTASTELASTPTPSSSIPGGRTTYPNGGRPKAPTSVKAEPASPVKKLSDTIDLTDDDEVMLKPDGEDEDDKISLHVKSTCSCGPYLDKKKLCNLPPLIGPAKANTVLRQLVEHIVLSSYSSKKVLQLLAAERDKKTFASILKTLTTKLSVCPNVFSLNKVALCKTCDNKTAAPVVKPPDRPNNQVISQIMKSSFVPILPNGTTSQQTRTMQQPIKPPVILKPSVISKPSVTSKPLVTSKLPVTSKPPVISRPRLSSSGEQEDPVVGKIPSIKHVSLWSVDEVVAFTGSRDCRKFADVFREQEVDGKALMLLSLEEIHKVLGVTLGPAIKLHDDVQKLRKRPK